MELLEIEARKDHLEPGLQSTVSTFSDVSIALLQDFFNTSVVWVTTCSCHFQTDPAARNLP